jgi:hypothetical protein
MYANITINTNQLLDSGLLIDSYLLLFCIYSSNWKLIEEYSDKCGLISKPAIEKLKNNGYITIINDNITCETIKLTNKGLYLFEPEKLEHDRYFKELRETYLVKTPLGRRLQTNIDDVQKKYKALIRSEEDHINHLKCIKLYFDELRRSGKLEFAQALPAWINQKNYKVYLEEALKLDSEDINNNDGYNRV